MAQHPTPIYSWLGDRLFAVFVTLLGLVVMALALGMGWMLYLEGSEAIRRFGFLSFLTSSVWDPGVRLVFGAWPFVVGTAVTSIGALALALLPAIAVAIFSAEYAPRWLARLIDTLVDLIAAVPSVVIGIWGIFVLAPWLRAAVYEPLLGAATATAPWLVPYLGSPTGYGLLTATIILALMIVPYTAALSRDAIRLVPVEQREAAWALGATKWEVVTMAVLPFARGGIIAGAILSLGRAIGETMAVAMLIGNANTLPYRLFGPAATMPSVIVNEFREAVGSLHLSSLIAIGFYLFLIALAVNLLAALVQRAYAVTGGRAT